MDPLTQGLLGVGFSGLRKQKEKNPKPSHFAVMALISGISGMAADLDVLISSPTDSLLALEYHRHFTHSVFFIPFGALICAALAYGCIKLTAKWKSNGGISAFFSWRLVYLLCLLGYASHGILDCFTTYGTQYFWPITDWRLAFNGVSIIDPLVTLPLGLMVVWGLRKRNLVFFRLGVIYTSLYLGLGLWQSKRAGNAAEVFAARRGHSNVLITAKPSFANIVLWKTVYQYEGRYYVDAIRIGLPWNFRKDISEADWHEGESIASLDWEGLQNQIPPESRLFQDIKRFDWFSKGYVAWHPDQENTIIDVRYSMLPNEISPLWGIAFQPDKPDDHAQYLTFTENRGDRLQDFWEMLFNE